MKRYWILISVVAWLASGAASWAADTITPASGKLFAGHVIRMTAQEIEVETGRGDTATTKTIPVNEIKSIAFEDEPRALTAARNHMNQEEYDQAEQYLDKLTVDEANQRPEVAADIEFYKALWAARQAQGGNGEIADAAGAVEAFAQKYRTNYHYLEACELAGTLLVAERKYARAETYYAELAKAPWEDFKMRAGIGAGRALLAQAKTAAALKAFEEVLANTSTSDAAKAQRLAAKLGQARCLAAMKRTAEAIKIAQEIIDQADPDNTDLLAEAYNTLGTALRKTGHAKEAMLAFLHVDVLYDSVPDLHAEALANLVELFNEMHKPDHAGICEQKLKRDYKNSPWAAEK
jgi:tetratricopeptide (TPR) repeat protein